MLSLLSKSSSLDRSNSGEPADDTDKLRTPCQYAQGGMDAEERTGLWVAAVVLGQF